MAVDHKKIALFFNTFQNSVLLIERLIVNGQNILNKSIAPVSRLHSETYRKKSIATFLIHRTVRVSIQVLLIKRKKRFFTKMLITNRL